MVIYCASFISGNSWSTGEQSMALVSVDIHVVVEKSADTDGWELLEYQKGDIFYYDDSCYVSECQHYDWYSIICKHYKFC